MTPEKTTITEARDKRSDNLMHTVEQLATLHQSPEVKNDQHRTYAIVGIITMVVVSINMTLAYQLHKTRKENDQLISELTAAQEQSQQNCEPQTK